MQYLLPLNIPKEIFRAYDIRGVADESLSADMTYALGLAIGSEAAARNQTQVVVARDGRLSGHKLSKALIAGLMASGREVIDIGMVPTPVLYFATHWLKTHSGVMLTGSHNPANYNGLKIVLSAETLAESDIQGLYQRILDQRFIYRLGSLKQIDITQDYLNCITQDVHVKRPLKVVIDAGNGVTGIIAPQLYRQLGCEVVETFCEVDGNFPNHHPDPTEAKNLQDLQQAVLKHQADLGLAFDGDGDRLGVVTNQGEIICPDRFLMLFAQDTLLRNPGAEIIFDVKCSRYLPWVIKQAGGKPLMWKTGHSLVKAKLRQTGAPLAGEMSGHVFFKERWFGFDDGMYAGARLLEILSQTLRTVHEIFADLPNGINTPELKLPLSDDQKIKFMHQLSANSYFKGGEVNAIDGLRVDFSDGWGLVRMSNTTPCLVLRFEADNEASLKRIQNVFREQLLSINKDLVLPF